MLHFSSSPYLPCSCVRSSQFLFFLEISERERKKREKGQKVEGLVVWLAKLRRKKDLLCDQAPPQHLAFLLFSFLSFSLLDQSALLPSLMSATHMTAPIKKRRRTEPEETDGGGGKILVYKKVSPKKTQGLACSPNIYMSSIVVAPSCTPFQPLPDYPSSELKLVDCIILALMSSLGYHFLLSLAAAFLQWPWLSGSSQCPVTFHFFHAIVAHLRCRSGG